MKNTPGWFQIVSLTLFILSLKSITIIPRFATSTSQLEKHIWICAFMAIGAKYRCTVGEVEKKYDESVRMLINELARTATKVRTHFVKLMLLFIVHSFVA